ncbi:MAG: hypothetical protein COB67_07405 [SAR324 cluster bacterium]|uniref:Uncharacterized protein n=1 Tax=SAR324 cluster bacterium TaxID=2024889 RepID=A0A2A4T383_9DELT|nr:MAG: hypothetical protein COB67_07405 [SAR324 cluster bacterium]
MNLFTFNFKNVISIFLLLLGIYSLLLMIIQPKVIMFQNIQQKNYSFAQEFIYGNKAPNIIVGSSMAARMKNEFLSEDFVNLSFAGGSVLTGLQTIKKSGFIPKTIYIEENIIFRDKDQKLIDAVFYPLWWKVKKYIFVLQEKYQPLNIIISKLKGSYGKSHEEYMKEIRNEHIYKMNLMIHKKNLIMPFILDQSKLDNLKSLINYFEENGTLVFFFEMPIAKELENSAQLKRQRDIIKNNFENEWLEIPKLNKYMTEDGIHLMYKSAYTFSFTFQERAESLLEEIK